MLISNMVMNYHNFEFFTILRNFWRCQLHSTFGHRGLKCSSSFCSEPNEVLAWKCTRTMLQIVKSKIKKKKITIIGLIFNSIKCGLRYAPGICNVKIVIWKLTMRLDLIKNQQTRTAGSWTNSHVTRKNC